MSSIGNFDAESTVKAAFCILFTIVYKIVDNNIVALYPSVRVGSTISSSK